MGWPLQRPRPLTLGALAAAAYRIVLVEGNYVLLSLRPWDELRLSTLDDTWWARPCLATGLLGGLAGLASGRLGKCSGALEVA